MRSIDWCWYISVSALHRISKEKNHETKEKNLHDVIFRSSHYSVFWASVKVNVYIWWRENLHIKFFMNNSFSSLAGWSGWRVCVCVRLELIMLFLKSTKWLLKICTKQISMWTKWSAIKLHYCWTVNCDAAIFICSFLLFFFFWAIKRCTCTHTLFQ